MLLAHRLRPFLLLTLLVPSAAKLMSAQTGTDRFVAAHGRKAVIMGYGQTGLEIWGYPFQILSNYQVNFRPSGTTAALDGRTLLRRVDYAPDSITRVYIGPDFLVRERLFVPLDRAAAVISYEVEGIRPIDLDVRFLPVLNLMWPGALGGQYTRWLAPTQGSPGVPAFVIAEPGRGFTAAIGSREITTHDDAVNSAIRPDTLNFSLHPAARHATVYIALNPASTKQPAAVLETLATDLPRLERDATAHYSELARSSLRIRTPDDAVNQALASTVTALDQAWVCNDLLGCGIIAGYGPSRDARRPQYDWFFGGDGLVATNALLSAGEYTRARDELTFIQKYQDPATGIIWHELSQSAGLIDWSKYPYMYVHVDISFDYLQTVARYVAITGDLAFARDHWRSIAAAYRYCQTQIQRGDHLPHIPPDKEAGDEQHRPADDLTLSASWMAAASGFAELATLTGHTAEAQQARTEAELTRQSIPGHYWNAAKQFWFDSHTASGEPLFRHATGPTQLLAQDVFPPEQNRAILDQLTSADFQTDWGIRQVAASSPDFNPYSYGAGSISALGTSAVATSLWQAHRPESAASLWNGVVQWNTLDSVGHLHEVLAGNFYHEETESVPEQTWSSAALLDSAVGGLLGLQVDGLNNKIRFAPHLPADWPEVAFENVHLPHATLGFHLQQSTTALDLDIDNGGSATSLLFAPQIPLGAQLGPASCQNRALSPQLQAHASDQHVTVNVAVPSGRTHCHIAFSGGVSLVVPHPALRVGDASSQPKIVDVSLHGHTLAIDSDVLPSGNSTIRLRTPWLVNASADATVQALPDHIYEVHLQPPGSSAPARYTRLHTELTLTER